VKEDEIQAIIGEHNTRWDNLQSDMAKFERSYRARMWDRMSGDVIVETPDGHSLAEGYIASLFPKAPAVEVIADAQDRGDPDLVRKVVNHFLAPTAALMKRAMRYAFVFPSGFLKVGFKEAEVVIDQVEARAVHPWDIVVDLDADTWERQRWVGHRYWLSVSEARKRWPGRKWNGARRKSYLDEGVTKRVDLDSSGSDMIDEVLIYEMYFPKEDKLIFYSEYVTNKSGIVRKGKIPYRKGDGTPLVPIVDLYFKEDLRQPLRGMSTIGLLYDQLWEKNNIRTERARDVRRNARQMVVKAGSISDEDKAIFNANEDGAILELDLPPEIPATQAMAAVPTPPVSRDYDLYEARIDSDLSTGDIRSPITRGQSTGASATEIAALTQYLSTEVGQMAVVRDAMFGKVAEVYIAILKWRFETEKHPEDLKTPIVMDGKARLLSNSALEGYFRFAAVDQGSTPVGKAVERQQLERLTPTLVQLGADPRAVLREIVRRFDLPEELVPPEEAVAPTPQEAPGAQATTPVASEDMGGVPLRGGQAAAQLRQRVLDGEM
jgi:hypothetical protein